MNELVAAALDVLFGLMDPSELRGSAQTEPNESILVDRQTPLLDVSARFEPRNRQKTEWINQFLARPVRPEGFPTGDEVRSSNPLFVLTNRLNPFAIATRVLMNITIADGSPLVSDFNEIASTCARALGLRLRATDKRTNRRGAEKRAIAWPIGEDERKSRDRFIWSFLLFPSPDNGSDGPLAEMGLATVSDDKAFLTERGVALASASSALLEEAPGWTLSVEEQSIIREALTGLPGEMDEVLFFLASVSAAKGSQTSVERALMKRHSSWSPNRVTAHRAAMIGRLRDIDAIAVSGSGPSAVIEIKSAGNELFRDQSKREAV